jgi:hypothetical protein
MATPTYRIASDKQQLSGSTIVINKPTGVVANDILYAIISYFTSATTVTAPSGWVQVGSTFVGSSYACRFYRKVAGGSEPVSYTWTFGASQAANGSIYRYDSTDTTTPEDASSQSNGTGTSITINSVTPATTGAVQIALMSNLNGPYGSAPAGWTLDHTDGGASNGVSHRNATLTAGTPSGSASQSLTGGSSEWVCLSIALKPLNSGTTMTAILDGTGDLVANITVAHALSVALDGTGDLLASLTVAKALQAALDGTSDLLASLTVAHALQATLDAAGNLQAQLTLAHALQAILSGVGDFQAQLTIVHVLAALLDGQGNLLATLATLVGALKSPNGLVVDAVKPLGSVAQGGLVGSAADDQWPGGTATDSLKPSASVGLVGPTGTVVNS